MRVTRYVLSRLLNAVFSRGLAIGVRDTSSGFRIYRRLAPGGYADEHITHYTRASLVDLVSGFGYRHPRTDYVLRSEMILTFERARG